MALSVSMNPGFLDEDDVNSVLEGKSQCEVMCLTASSHICLHDAQGFWLTSVVIPHGWRVKRRLEWDLVFSHIYFLLFSFFGLWLEQLGS